jgi:hypothetical protein
MPVPAVPRRTGPPRKKPSKPTAPPPEPPKGEPVAAVLDVDITESTSVAPAPKEASPTIEDEVSALTGDLEASALQDESEKSEVVKPAESVSPLPDAHSPVLQQADLPSAQTLEISSPMETVDENIPQHSSSSSGVFERASGIGQEEDEDDVSDKRPIPERLSGIHPLTAQPGLSSSPASVLEEVRSKPSKSVREDVLHGN